MTTIYKIQAYNSKMFGYYCIGFIDFILKGKSFFEYTNLFPPKEHEKNNKIILKYFQRIKTYLIVCDKCRKFKTPKIQYIFKKRRSFYCLQ